MDEYIVERGVLHAERSERFAQRGGQLDQLHGGFGAGGSEHAIEAGALGLHAGHAVQAFQALLPLVGFAVEMHFDHVGAGNAVLELDGRAQRHQFAVIDNGDAVAELVGLFHVVGGDAAW